MTKRIQVVIAVLALLVVAQSAYLIYSQYLYQRPVQFRLTREEQLWLKHNGTGLRVSTEPDFPPTAYVQNGQIRGLINDYYALLEERLKVNFVRVETTSLGQMLELARQGRLDIVGPLAQTDARSQYLLFTQALIEYPAVMVVEDRNSKLATLESLRGRRIAVSRDYAIWPYLVRNYPFHDFVAVDNDWVAPKLVAFGQVAAAISDVGTASRLIKNQGFTNLKITSQTGYYYVLRIASRRDQPILNSILSKALASISQQEKDRIYRKWIKVDMGPLFAGQRTARRFLALSLTLLALLAGVGLWNKSLSRRVAERTAELRAYQDSLAGLVDERTHELSAANRMLSETNEKLTKALAEVKTLSGFIPICAYCKKVRDDQGYWKQVEEYIASRSDAEFSHGLCPDCLSRLYPEFETEPVAEEAEDTADED